jgi:hypothetical protein
MNLEVACRHCGSSTRVFSVYALVDFAQGHDTDCPPPEAGQTATMQP